MSIQIRNKYRGTIPHGVIVSASLGDPIAIQAVLRHYRGYISKLATRVVYDDYGNSFLTVDTDVSDYMEDSLITGILKFNAAA